MPNIQMPTEVVGPQASALAKIVSKALLQAKGVQSHTRRHAMEIVTQIQRQDNEVLT